MSAESTPPKMASRSRSSNSCRCASRAGRTAAARGTSWAHGTSEPHAAQTNSSTVKWTWWSGEWLKLVVAPAQSQRRLVRRHREREGGSDAHVGERRKRDLMERVDREAARRDERVGVEERLEARPSRVLRAAGERRRVAQSRQHRLLVKAPQRGLCRAGRKIVRARCARGQVGARRTHESSGAPLDLAPTDRRPPERLLAPPQPAADLAAGHERPRALAVRPSPGLPEHGERRRFARERLEVAAERRAVRAERKLMDEVQGEDVRRRE